MKEGFIKFIIIVLTAFFSVSMLYAETDYNKSIWNTSSTIGYELDHFSPSRLDSIEKVSKSSFLTKRLQRYQNKCKEIIEDNKKNKGFDAKMALRIVGRSLVIAIFYCIIIVFDIIIVLHIIGLISVISVKIYHKNKNKS